MGKVKRLQFWGILCVMLATIITPTMSHAQSTESGTLNLTTSPLPISLVAKPGQTATTELRIKNSGSKTETLKVGLMKFTASGEDGSPLLQERQPGDDYFDWVSFSQNQFVAQPNEWHSITMTIKLPPSAALGYYYAVTFSRADAPNLNNDKQAKVLGGAAILILLNADVLGAVRKLELESFSVDHKTYEFLPVNFKVKLKNSGNLHLAPAGTIYINKGKTTIATLTLNKAAGNILPGSKRIFSVNWDDGFPIYKTQEVNGKMVLKNGQQVQSLHWDGAKLTKLRFGKYTARLTMVYDDGQRDIPVEATVQFWVIPWRIIGFTLLPIIAFGLLLYGYLRLSRRVKKLQQKEQESKKS